MGAYIDNIGFMTLNIHFSDLPHTILRRRGHGRRNTKDATRTKLVAIFHIDNIQVAQPAIFDTSKGNMYQRANLRFALEKDNSNEYLCM